MTRLELNDHDKAALTDVLRATIAAIASLVLVVASAAAVALAQTPGAPIVSRPSSAAVSPNLSDLPTAHRSHGENPKEVPRPKPLLPRKAGVSPSR